MDKAPRAKKLCPTGYPKIAYWDRLLAIPVVSLWELAEPSCEKPPLRLLPSEG
jgi:hypothetical protein